MKPIKPKFWMFNKETHEITGTDDVLEWGKYMNIEGARIVQQDTVNGYLVSTVFLGLDHSFDFGVPVLFETMIFDEVYINDKGESVEERRELHDYQERYHTYEEAVEGHKKALELAKHGSTT